MPPVLNGKRHRPHQQKIFRRARSSAKRHTRMSRPVEHQFDDIHQQREAAYQGMWIFLTTEVLFFGAVLFAYTVYRGLYYRAFLEGSHHLSVAMGGINTAVLLCSSLCMALAVHAAQ